MNVYKYNTIVVGSGAAGLSCLDILLDRGVDCALVTEGMAMGTSRNTGSDKQTYYKLTLTGGEPDSVLDMANTLFNGGAMNGDTALCEAAGSAGAFYRLCRLGVPFPSNEYGEYVGYQTDHDKRKRATSCGPLTSKYMTESLEKSVRSKNAVIFDGLRVIEISVENGRLQGFFAVNHGNYNAERFELCYFACANLVWATGGPSAIYDCSVYPESQTCAHGTLLRAGAEGVNLTESQYGIASLGFRWNLSGSYQQVIPRYFSTASDGVSDERELELDPNLIFLKGYQWPFDPRKLPGSSEIDLAVYKEMQSGRRVFLDYGRDADNYSFSTLSSETSEYLIKSGAASGSPIERLRKLNERAYKLFFEHGIDLAGQPLEIAVCAQHNNGGFAVDINYQSSIAHVFVVGEAAGVFGVYRPGGSALNSTQVSSMRAAKFIADNFAHDEPCTKLPKCEILSLLNSEDDCYENNNSRSFEAVTDCMNFRKRFGKLFDGCAAFIRNKSEVFSALEEVRAALDDFKIKSSLPAPFCQAAINFDILTTQYIYLSAIYEYICNGGKSRGSYLINSDPSPDTLHSDKICYSSLNDGKVSHRWEKVRPIPNSEQWFENVYNSVKTDMK